MRRLVIAAALVGLAGGGWLWYEIATPAPTLTRPVLVVLLPGARAQAAAAALARQGVVRSPLAFRLAARLSGKWPRVQAGSYRIRPGMSPLAIMDLFASGRCERVCIVIPEGWTTSQIGRRLAANGLGDGSPLGPADISRYPPGLPLPPDGRLEGYLFPDTYFVPQSPRARRELAEMMLGRLDELVWRGLLGGQPPADGRSLHDLLTLASLVEGEAKLDRERPLIAGVLANRLRKGQRLECDATVLYALGNPRRPLTRSDLAVDSPYNTYRYAGLPPGPINNPGLASIRAALHPAQVPYLYYVARPDGSHAFSRTYEQHLAAIRAIRGR